MENTVGPKKPEPSATPSSVAQASVQDSGIETRHGGQPQGAGRPGIAGRFFQASHLPWAWLPMPLFLLAICGLLIWKWPTPYESPYLLLGLNFVFTMLASFLTTYLAFRAFLINGKPGSMLLGCGLFIWGGTTFVATLVVHIGPNAAVTVHNLGVLLAALCHLAAAVLRWRSEGTVNAVGLWLTAGITTTVGVAGLVSIAAVAGWTPVFFIPGSGGTPVRQIVLWISIGTFTATAGLMAKEYRRTPSVFLYWYASGLALIAVGLFGVMMQSIPGSIICWVGRAAQFLGGAYILVAAFAALRESRVWGLPLELVLRDTQARLKDQIERYELVLAGANAALWDWDVPNKRVVFSPQWKVLHGFDEKEDVEQEEAWQESIHPEDRERVLAALQRHFKGQTAAYSEEYRIVCRDGTVKWIFDRGLAKWDTAGRVVRMAGSEIDITERKRSEEALRENERRLSLAFSATADAIWEWDLVTNQTYYSPRWYAMLGYAPHEITMDFDGWKSLCYPDDLRPTMDAIQSSLDSDSRAYAVEFRMRSKDGAWKWILGRGRVVAYDKAGKPVLLSGTNTDITERKQAEKALRASEARLAAILNQLPVGVGVIDTCGRFILRNALMRTCMSDMMPSRDPAQRHRWHAVETAERPIPPEQWPGARALRGESVVPGMEFIHTEAGGRERWLIVSAVPANLKENEIGAIVVAQDITELKEAEHALRDTNEELSEYTYAVVHNLKAPFRAVQNYANFLIEDLGDSLAGEPRQFLDGIKSALKQAHHQFSDLDALYRIRNYEAEFETLDLGPLLNEFAFVHRTASDRQLIISDRWPVVRGERLLMSQILAELINNGFKYNRSDTKTVEVGWQPAADGRRLEIFVRDNGIGIDPQYYEHIFHIFKRLHTEEEYEGTGIGLAIVRRAVKKIGGGLRIESAAGKGSTFVISLPSALIEE